LAGPDGASGAHLAFLREVKPGVALVIERPDGARLTYRIGTADIVDKAPLRYVLLAFLS
jgi:hypothetical protein